MDSALTYREAMRRYLWPIVAAAGLLLFLLAWSLGRDPQADRPPGAVDSARAGPPWYYGPGPARFTVVEYADLECPYCKAYFPVLKQWIDTHADVNWQWHHLPLPMHEPAATRSARLAECAGEIGGTTAFWNAVAWIHQHSLGSGQGLPAGVEFPGSTPALRDCLASTRPDSVIRAQADDALQSGVSATPTLRLIDNETGRSLLLPGAIAGDALLSAFDLLVSADGEALPAGAIPDTSETPTDASSRPR